MKEERLATSQQHSPIGLVMGSHWMLDIQPESQQKIGWLRPNLYDSRLEHESLLSWTWTGELRTQIQVVNFHCVICRKLYMQAATYFPSTSINVFSDMQPTDKITVRCCHRCCSASDVNRDFQVNSLIADY